MLQTLGSSTGRPRRFARDPLALTGFRRRGPKPIRPYGARMKITPAEIEERLYNEIGLNVRVQAADQGFVVTGLVPTPDDQALALDFVRSMAEASPVVDMLEVEGEGRSPLANAPDFTGTSYVAPADEVARPLDPVAIAETWTESVEIAGTLVLPDSGGAPQSSPSVLFIGNATLLIRIAGITILTDPAFVHAGEQVDLGNGLSSTRLHDPAMDMDELPPIDMVLLSHFHGDHFDQVAQQRLNPATPIVTTPESARKLEESGFHNCRPLETWQTLLVEKGDHRVRITAVPGRHGPPVVSMALPDVMGSILEFEGAAEPKSIYLTGDTLVIDELAQIGERFGLIDMAFVHLGGTRVLGIMVTMDAEQGVKLLQVVQPAAAIPVHFDDFDVFTSPLQDFKDAVAAAGLEGMVTYLSRGESWSPAAGPPAA